MESRFLELAAQVFRYPAAGLNGSLSGLEAYCAEKNPSLAAKAGQAVKEAAKFSLTELEEIYADLFYIKPLVSLDVGFQLFGDERKRVEFLLHLKGLQQKHKADCGDELPDSLPNALMLLTKLEAGEDREELIDLALAPALAKMVSILARAGKEKAVKEKSTKDHEKRRAKGLAVYLPLLELLLEVVKTRNCPAGTGI